MSHCDLWSGSVKGQGVFPHWGFFLCGNEGLHLCLHWVFFLSSIAQIFYQIVIKIHLKGLCPRWPFPSTWNLSIGLVCRLVGNNLHIPHSWCAGLWLGNEISIIIIFIHGCFWDYRMDFHGMVWVCLALIAQTAGCHLSISGLGGKRFRPFLVSIQLWNFKVKAIGYITYSVALRNSTGCNDFFCQLRSV